MLKGKPGKRVCNENKQERRIEMELRFVYANRFRLFTKECRSNPWEWVHIN